MAGFDSWSEALGKGAPRRSQADLSRQLFQLCRAHLWGVALVFLLQVTQISASIIALRYLGGGIDYMKAWVAGDTPSSAWPLGIAPPSDWPVWAVPLFAAGMMALLSVARAVLSAQATVKLSLLLHDRIIPDLQRRVFRQLQQLSFRFFDRQHSGAIINRVTGDVQAVRMFVENGVLETMTLGLTSLIYAVYMIQVSPVLALACMAPLPIMAVLAVRLSRAVHPQYLVSRDRFDRMLLNVSENTQGAFVVKSLGLEEDSRSRFSTLNASVQEGQRAIFRRVSLLAPLLNLLNHSSLVILLVYGGWLVIQGDFALGTGFVVFATLLQQLSNQISSLSQVVISVQESLSGAQRVFEILDADPGLSSPRFPLASGKVKGAVAMVEVGFGYDPDRPTLSGISFDARPGELIAVVGETGAGKSALLSLIPRFYDPDHGVIRIDGVDARDWDLPGLRRQVGVVFQEPFLFSTTLAENIRLGAEGATDEDVERAARLARAHDFILRTEHGYETVLEENGTNLSGGQRQRIALARALVADPAILLLDDPTSAVDPETEHEIFAAMDDAMHSRTTFVIAHRVATLQRADRILVLDAGRLVTIGTHAELLRSNALYREAAATQLEDAGESLSPKDLEVPSTRIDEGMTA